MYESASGEEVVTLKEITVRFASLMLVLRLGMYICFLNIDV